MEVWYGCAGVSSGITSIGVRQDRAKSRDMPYTSRPDAVEAAPRTIRSELR
jgi:hypothetical protein